MVGAPSGDPLLAAATSYPRRDPYDRRDPMGRSGMDRARAPLQGIDAFACDLMLEFISELARYGLLGLVSAMSIYGYLSERKDNKSLREELARVARAGAERDIERATRFASLVSELQLAHTAKLDRQEAEHQRQEEELTSRLVESVKSHAENNGRLTEKIAKVLEAVNRRGRP